MTRAEQFRDWFDYEARSHETVRASLEAVIPPRRGDPAFQKAIDLMAHVVQARRLWLHRFGAPVEAPGDIFPTPVPVKALAGQFTAMEEPWRAWMAQLDEAELERRFRYTSLDGRRWESAVHEILTQLHGHSLYHRGQVALLLRLIGEVPPVTDYVFATRRAV